MNWSGCLTVLLALTTPLALRAQSPADRVMLAAWDDSLQQIHSAVPLGQFDILAHQSTTSAKALRISMYKVRSALVRNDRPDLELAFDNLTLDITQHPTWSWPHIAMAEGFFAAETQRMPVLESSGLKYTEPYLSGAWRHLQLAVQLDPGNKQALRLAIEELLPGEDRTLRAEELAFVKVGLGSRFPDPDLLLVYARYLRAQRRFDSANKVLAKAVFAGGDKSRLALERARTLIALHDSSGASTAYWEGLDHITPAGRALYRQDLAWVISADSLATFDKVPDRDLATWMRRFWNARDAYSANEPGERLLEQLRRWLVAFTQYRTFQPWRKTLVRILHDGTICSAGLLDTGDETKLYDGLKVQPTEPDDPRGRETVVDHRGIIYLRHGEPDARYHSRPFSFAPLPDTPPPSLPTISGMVFDTIHQPPVAGTELWAYQIAGQWRVLTFAGMQFFGGSMLKAFPPAQDTVAWHWAGQFVPEYAAAANELSEMRRLYPPPNNRGPLACPTRKKMNDVSRVDARVADSTDSDSPPIAYPWNAVIRSYALGQGNGHDGKALLTFAFGARDLLAVDSTNRRFDFPVNIRVVAYRAATDETIRLDTLKHFGLTTRAGWASGWLEFPLPSGEWQIAVYARQDGSKGGAYTVQQGLSVDSVTKLTLSDIVMGRQDATGWKAPDGVLFPVNPVGVWLNGGTADVYYEVRGLPAGTQYATTIQVQLAKSTGRPLISITSNDQSSGGLTYVRKSLGLEQLAPGSYELTVTVESNGSRATRHATLVIEK